LSPKITDARQSLERMGDSASEAGSDSARLADRIQSISGVTDTAEASLRDLSQAQMRAQGATGSLGTTASSTASQLSVDLTQSAQDAAFGIENLAASAPFLMEQWTRLQTETGSTTSAFGKLFSAIKGPTGLVLAFSVLLQFKDRIIGFFTDTEEAAEDASEAAKEVDSVLRNRLASLADERDLEEVNQIIADIRDRIEELRDTQLPDEEITIGFQTRGGEFLSSEEVGLSPPEGAEPVTAQDRIDQLQRELDNVQTKREQIRKEIGQANALRRAGIRITEEQEESDEGVAEAIEEEVARAAETLQATELPEGSPLSGTIGPEGGFDVPQLSADDFRGQTAEELKGTIEGLEAAMSDMDLSSEMEKETERVIGSLKDMREQMLLAKGEAIDLGPALERGLASAIGAAAQAVGEGENVAKAILTTLANLAQRVGQMLIGFGTSMLSLQSIITNPVGAIAAGSALVALGAAAKNAISEQFDDATEGRSRGARRDQIPGGGRATGELDVPGRRRGGPVEGGQLYQTHGLGEREFFMPATDGAIVTEQAIRAAAGSSSRRRVDVRTDHNVNLDVTEPNLFELRARLNELENSVSQLR
jgi:hypothetical protein